MRLAATLPHCPGITGPVSGSFERPSGQTSKPSRSQEPIPPLKEKKDIVDILRQNKNTLLQLKS